jgi:hypothetical protein
VGADRRDELRGRRVPAEAEGAAAGDFSDVGDADRGDEQAGGGVLQAGDVRQVECFGGDGAREGGGVAVDAVGEEVRGRR